MLITLAQHSEEATPPLIIGVDEDRAEEVIRALHLQGWRVISSVYESPSEVADRLQIALLEVSDLPQDAPLRTAVEQAASAALQHTPLRDRRLQDRARFSRSLVLVPASREPTGTGNGNAPQPGDIIVRREVHSPAVYILGFFNGMDQKTYRTHEDAMDEAQRLALRDRLDAWYTADEDDFQLVAQHRPH